MRDPREIDNDLLISANSFRLRTDHRRNLNIVQLTIFPNAAQQQSAARHIAQADELSRHTKPAAENRCKDVQVFPRRDTPQKHDLTLRPDLSD